MNREEKVKDQVKSIKFHIGKLVNALRGSKLECKAEVIVRDPESDRDLQTVRRRHHWTKKD